MAEGIKNIGNIASHTYRGQAPETQRAMAVAAALEVIAAYAASSITVNLDAEFKGLSGYADQIQEALKVAAE